MDDEIVQRKKQVVLKPFLLCCQFITTVNWSKLPQNNVDCQEETWVFCLKLVNDIRGVLNVLLHSEETFSCYFWHSYGLITIMTILFLPCWLALQSTWLFPGAFWRRRMCHWHSGRWVFLLSDVNTFEIFCICLK